MAGRNASQKECEVECRFFLRHNAQMTTPLSSELLLAAYSKGYFPMSDDAHSETVHWVCPEMRGQISISDMHIPRRLKKDVRQMKIGGAHYEIRINSDFLHVIKACAKISYARQETWINKEIIDAYCMLHTDGYAHSVECWQNNKMIGGLYGIALGAAFFGESMFSIATNASKVCLVHLAARLHYAGYTILDTQFINDHLIQFGVHEISHDAYIKQLQPSLSKACIFDFDNRDEAETIAEYLDFRYTQNSDNSTKLV